MVRVKDSTFGLIVGLAVTCSIFVLVGYPVVAEIFQSFYSTNVLRHTNTFVGLGNYITLLSNTATQQSILLTIDFVLVCTLLSTGLALGSALVLNETFRGRSLLAAFVLMPWAISEVVTGLVWGTAIFGPAEGILTQLLKAVGLASNVPGTTVVWLTQSNAIYLVAVAFSWHVAPLGAFFLLAALGTVPEDMYKAAKIDGARTIARFRHVTFHFIKYALLVVLVFVTALSFKAFDIFYAMTYGGPGTSTTVLSFLIYRDTFLFSQQGIGAALSWILVIITTAFALVYFYFLSVRRKKIAAETTIPE